jgi:4-aminobutyrate aminotransferase/(S)-3-amino-2-methylpropionate transaminase
LQSLATNTQLSVLSFQNGFHGRIGGTLTLTRSKPIQKIGIPQFNWPKAPFPLLKYPIKENKEYNDNEEARCLTELEDILISQSNICAMIVEPVQAEGGDHWATPQYFRNIRKLASKYGVTFIIDEVQTGMATGRMWCHELWNLETPPDIVTFAKKFQASGLFVSDEMMSKGINTNFCGDTCFDLFRLYNLSEILKVVENGELFLKSEKASMYFKNKFNEINQTARKNNVFTNLRGKANFLAFDLPDSKQRDSFVKYARNKGVFISGCGENAIRLRPTLLVNTNHYDHLLDVITNYPQSSDYITNFHKH